MQGGNSNFFRAPPEEIFHSKDHFDMAGRGQHGGNLKLV